MFNPDKPVQTRDGRKARIVSADGGNTFQIAAWVKVEEDEHMEVFDASGSYCGDGKENRNDLINIPETYVMWQNIGVDMTGHKYVQSVHQSLHGAEKHKRNDRTECIRVEFKEGQFDK